MNKIVTWDIIKQTLGNSKVKWVWVCVCQNPNIVWDNILELIELIGIYDDRGDNTNRLTFWDISKHAAIPVGFIMANTDKKWNWYALGGNQCITMEYVRFYRDKTIGMMNNNTVYHVWMQISANEVITWRDVVENLDIPWNWSILCAKEGFKMEYVRLYRDIRIGIINYYEDRETWMRISAVKAITWKDVVENPDMPWNWIVLSRRGDMLLSGIEKVRIVRQHFACLVIQRAWRECIANPEYMLCRRRLLREAADLC
jgi:hypothetical protein